MNETAKNILIVDDIDAVRKALALILEDEGYNILQASNGLEALNLLDNLDIDLIITDILMPEMDGIELVTEVNAKFPHQKIILISGGGRQIDNNSNFDYLGQASRLTGISHVLKKPFNPEEIIGLIDSLLND